MTVKVTQRVFKKDNSFTARLERSYRRLHYENQMPNTRLLDRGDFQGAKKDKGHTSNTLVL